MPIGEEKENNVRKGGFKRWKKHEGGPQFAKSNCLTLCVELPRVSTGVAFPRIVLPTLTMNPL
jgi:hypothetical protein